MKTWIGLSVLLLAAGLLIAVPMPDRSRAQGQLGAVQFQDVTSQVLGNVVVTDPGGPEDGNWGWIAVGDWDGTGWPGLALNTWPGIHLFKNQQGTFVEVPAPRINGDFYARIGIWCDTEGSGHDDLLLGGVGELYGTWMDHWYRVDPMGALTEVTPAAVSAATPKQVLAMTCADIDRDGRLDVFEAATAFSTDPPPIHQNRVWMNKGGGVFADEADARGFGSESDNNPYALQCADLATPPQGFPSCLGVGNDYNYWFLNLGNGVMNGGTTGAYTNFMILDPYLADAAFADFDGSGRTGVAFGDTTLTDANSTALHIGCNTGAWNPFIGRSMSGMVECWRAPNPPGGTWIGHSVSRLVVADFDNSGYQSIFEGFKANPWGFFDPNRLWMNVGSMPGRPNFVDMGQASGIATACPSGYVGAAASIDYDLDGRVDLIIGCNGIYWPGPFRVFRNVTVNNNGWIGFILQSPRMLGTWVTVTACGRTQKQQLTARTGWSHQDDRHVHFGLGICASPVQVTIAWPDGATFSRSVPPGHYYMANEATGGLALFK